jgi:hypothetical protein
MTFSRHRRGIYTRVASNFRLGEGCRTHIHAPARRLIYRPPGARDERARRPKFAPLRACARGDARGSRPAPRLEDGLTYGPGLWPGPGTSHVQTNPIQTRPIRKRRRTGGPGTSRAPCGAGFVPRFAPLRPRAREGIKGPAPRLEGGLTYRPGLGRRQHSSTILKRAQLRATLRSSPPARYQR